MYQADRPGISFDVSLFSGAEELLEKVEGGQRFDVYFLDIIMPGTNGIGLARQIRQRDVNGEMVFVTQSMDYALDAYRVNAAQYIVKPVEKESMYAVLDKIIARREQEKDLFHTLSAPGRTVTILYSNIVLIEYIGRTLRFHLTTGGYVESKTIRTAFNQALADILKDERFLWIHQSFVINMACVKELRNRSFIMANGVEITIPRPKYVTVKNRYLAYLADKIAGVRTRKAPESD
jgi:DNA-binding LytR/AlgR family response regulator